MHSSIIAYWLSNLLPILICENAVNGNIESKCEPHAALFACWKTSSRVLDWFQTWKNPLSKLSAIFLVKKLELLIASLQHLNDILQRTHTTWEVFLTKFFILGHLFRKMICRSNCGYWIGRDTPKKRQWSRTDGGKALWNSRERQNKDWKKTWMRCFPFIYPRLWWIWTALAIDLVGTDLCLIMPSSRYVTSLRLLLCSRSSLEIKLPTSVSK